MKSIIMTKSESMLTAKGNLEFKIGQQYSVDDWIADSLAGRGYATLISSASSVAEDEIRYENLNVANLREMARQVAIPGYKKMHKEELIQALYDSRKRIIANPPPAPIEMLDITSGIKSPEFNAEG
jgi:hypothetical protein